MAIELVDANALLIHIPKTGGTWIEHALEAVGIRTAQPSTADGTSARHQLTADVLDRYDFSFAFVRHPVSWYESWWKFQALAWTTWEPDVWHPQRALEPCASDNFATFIHNCIVREPGFVTRMYEWYVGPRGRERVDFVGRYEALEDTLIGILHGLSYRFDEAALRDHPRVNVSAKRAGDPIWEPALRKRVEALEAPAIRRFYGGR